MDIPDEFENKEELKQYIDSLHNEIQWLERELEKSEKTILELRQGDPGGAEYFDLRKFVKVLEEKEEFEKADRLRRFIRMRKRMAGESTSDWRLSPPSDNSWNKGFKRVRDDLDRMKDELDKMRENTEEFRSSDLSEVRRNIESSSRVLDELPDDPRDLTNHGPDSDKVKEDSELLDDANERGDPDLVEQVTDRNTENR